MTAFNVPTASVVLRALLAAGLTLISFGLILGLVPMEVGDFDCSAPFGNGGDYFAGNSAACAVARYPRQSTSWLMIALGSGILVAVATAAGHRSFTQPMTPAPPSGSGPATQ